jgi:hypothetical protein
MTAFRDIAPCSFVDDYPLSELFTASIIKARSKAHARKLLVKQEQAGLGGNLDGPVNEGGRIERVCSPCWPGCSLFFLLKVGWV